MASNDSQRITLLIVDDHEIVRAGLRSLFEDAPEVKVVGEAATVKSAISEAVRLRPTVVLMDLRLSDGSGVDACRDILAAVPDTRVLFLTSYGDEEAVLAAVFAGADGYLMKEIDAESLIRAVKVVADGQSILDPAMIRKVTERLRAASEPSPARELLAPQERRVVALVAQGKTNKEIAAALNLSDKTVKNYLSNIFHKLRISRRSEAAAMFVSRPL